MHFEAVLDPKHIQGVHADNGARKIGDKLWERVAESLQGQRSIPFVQLSTEKGRSKEVHSLMPVAIVVSDMACGHPRKETMAENIVLRSGALQNDDQCFDRSGCGQSETDTGFRNAGAGQLQSGFRHLHHPVDETAGAVTIFITNASIAMTLRPGPLFWGLFGGHVSGLYLANGGVNPLNSNRQWFPDTGCGAINAIMNDLRPL